VNMYVAFCVLSPVSNLPAKEGSHKVIHFKQDPTYIYCLVYLGQLGGIHLG